MNNQTQQDDNLLNITNSLARSFNDWRASDKDTYNETPDSSLNTSDFHMEDDYELESDINSNQKDTRESDRQPTPYKALYKSSLPLYSLYNYGKGSKQY